MNLFGSILDWYDHQRWRLQQRCVCRHDTLLDFWVIYSFIGWNSWASLDWRNEQRTRCGAVQQQQLQLQYSTDMDRIAVAILLLEAQKGQHLERQEYDTKLLLMQATIDKRQEYITLCHCAHRTSHCRRNSTQPRHR